MGSKAIVFLGLFLAVALLISSEVTARDLAETTTTSATPADQQTNGVDDAKYFHRGDYHGPYHGGGGYHRGGGHYGGGGYGADQQTNGIDDAKYYGGGGYHRGGGYYRGGGYHRGGGYYGGGGHYGGGYGGGGYGGGGYEEERN